MTITLDITEEVIKEAEQAFMGLSSDIKSVDGKKLIEYILKETIKNPNWIVGQLFEGNIEDTIEMEYAGQTVDSDDFDPYKGGSELSLMGVVLVDTLETLFGDTIDIESEEQEEEENKRIEGLGCLLEDRDYELYRLQDNRMYFIVTAGDENRREITKKPIEEKDVEEFITKLNRIIEGD